MTFGVLTTTPDEYVERKGIKAGSATILNLAVPEDSPRCTEFYVELDNRKKTLLTLRWDPYACTVTVSKCRYTREEVESAAWAEGGASGISPEENAAVLEAQGGEETMAGTAGGTGREECRSRSKMAGRA